MFLKGIRIIEEMKNLCENKTAYLTGNRLTKTIKDIKVVEIAK